LPNNIIIIIETAGSWNGLAIEFVQEIGRRTTAIITEDARETWNSLPPAVRSSATYNIFKKDFKSQLFGLYF